MLTFGFDARESVVLLRALQLVPAISAFLLRGLLPLQPRGFGLSLARDQVRARLLHLGLGLHARGVASLLPLDRRGRRGGLGLHRRFFSRLPRFQEALLCVGGGQGLLRLRFRERVLPRALGLGRRVGVFAAPLCGVGGGLGLLRLRFRERVLPRALGLGRRVGGFAAPLRGVVRFLATALRALPRRLAHRPRRVHDLLWRVRRHLRL